MQYNGLTPLGTQLDAKVVRPFVAGPVQSRSLQKPVLVRHCMTTQVPLGSMSNEHGHATCPGTRLWSVLIRAVVKPAEGHDDAALSLFS